MIGESEAKSTGAGFLSVVIPTYGRDDVLLATIRFLLAMDEGPDEIIIVDQTPSHQDIVHRELVQLDFRGLIRWVRLKKPSITAAMNAGLGTARGSIVLFLDDDIMPDPRLVAAHRDRHFTHPNALIAGRVLQPWHNEQADAPGAPFTFNSLESVALNEFMGGNFSVSRESALQLGGFDENFVEVAYRFEAEFALRWRRTGRSIWYEPNALIHHLKAPSGGTRTYGDFLRTWRPSHSTGEYYFLLIGRPDGWRQRLLRRLIFSCATRHHLRRPWWIPATLVSEIWGLLQAATKVWKGPRLLVGGKS
jgi:GT2 family glycosyltransferase